MTIQNLMSLTTSQKESSFSLMFKENAGTIIARLRAHTITMEDAEDILQKAAVTMWQKRDTFSEGTSFIAWAWTIAKHTMFNFLRSKKRSVVKYGEILPEYCNDIPTPIKQNQDPRLLHMEDLLKKLSDREESILRAVYLEGKSISAYAEENKLSARTCFNTISLIRKKLKKQINERILLEMH